LPDKRPRENRIHESGRIANAQQASANKAPVLVGEITGGMEDAHETGVLHSFAHRDTGLPKASKNSFGRFLCSREFFLIHHATHAHLLRGERDQPKPFILQTNDNGVSGFFTLVQANAGKVAKNSQLLEPRMDHAQPFLIAGQIAAATGID
jgi:hypothetical protein